MHTRSNVATPPVRRAGCGALALLLASMLVALGLGELLVRLVAPQALVRLPEGVWTSDSLLGWRRTPNLDVMMSTGEREVRFVTDADGFRVAPGRPAAAATRILMIGDSFVEGTQVSWEGTLPAALERRLAVALERQVTVRAAAASAWDPGQYLQIAREILGRDSATAVVVVLYVGNDVVASRHQRMAADTPTAGTRRRDDIERNWLLPLNLWLRERSHLYALVKTATRPVATRLGLRRADIPPALTRGVSAAAWDTTAAIVRDIADLAACEGAPTLAVLIPAAIQVDTTELASALRALGLSRDEIDIDQPSRLLDAALVARGIWVTDALPKLRADIGAEPLYGRIERHLEPAGNEIVALAVAAALKPLITRSEWAPPRRPPSCEPASPPPRFPSRPSGD